MEAIPREMADVRLEIPSYQGIYYPLQSGYNTYICDVRKTIKLSSDGVWLHDSSLYYPIPLLLLQLYLFIVVSRLFYYLLRPLKQPRVVSDVIAGVLLGPLGLSRNAKLMTRLFPYKSITVQRVLAYQGIIFKLFVMNVKTDPALVLRSGKKAAAIGLVSLVVPVGVMIGLSSLLHHTGALHPDVAPFNSIVTMAILVSTTAFPVVADILTEIGLLNTELGRLAMSSSMINNFAGLLALALYPALQSKTATLHSIKTLSCSAALIIFTIFIFRPWMRWIVRRNLRNRPVHGSTVLAIMLVVLLAGVVSDVSGTVFIFGPIILGLAVPDGPPLGAALVEHIDVVATELLMPMVYLSSGLVVEFSEVTDVNNHLPVVRSTKWTVVIFVVGIVVKLVISIAPAIHQQLSMRNAVLLTFMLNFRGMVDVVNLLNYRFDLPNMGVYSVILLMSIGITAIVVPAVKTYYDPLGVGYGVGLRSIQHLKAHMELRMVACVHDEHAVPTIVNLMEASSAEWGNPLCVYVMHLVEQVGQASSSLIAHKNKKGFINPTHMDPLLNAFINFEQSKRGQVPVQPFTAIAPYKTMHQDICSLALEKNAAFILLPFMRNIEDNSKADRINRSIIPSVLSQAPCSVGILMVKGETVLPNPVNSRQHIGVLFWGGPDDREALSYAFCLARHSGVHLTVTRFLLGTHRDAGTKEQALDDEVFAEHKLEQPHNEKVVIQDAIADDMEKTIALMKSVDNRYDLVIVGRNQSSACLLDQELVEWSEFPELGLVGDMLCSSDFDSSFSVLVVHRHLKA